MGIDSMTLWLLGSITIKDSEVFVSEKKNIKSSKYFFHSIYSKLQNLHELADCTIIMYRIEQRRIAVLFGRTCISLNQKKLDPGILTR